MLLLTLCSIWANGQGLEVGNTKWYQPDTTYSPGRFWGLTGSISVVYDGALILLNQYWYKDYPRSPFHFFDDRGEWLQMDKAGHFFNGYWLSYGGIKLYRWTGMRDEHAVWMGGVVGTVLLTGIELLDGYSTKWGASLSDMAANIGGSTLAMGQEFAWQQQRIQIKISAHPITYDPDVAERADALFGHTLAETILKDYNALTIWASVTPADFMSNNTWFPKWLNVSLGYGADGLFGGYKNCWCEDPLISFEDCPDAERQVRYTPRLRQYYLSLDINWARIHSHSPLIRTLFDALNLVKVPAPALMLDSEGKVQFYPVYF